VHRQVEHVGGELGQRGLVPLAVGLLAGEQRDATIAIEPEPGLLRGAGHRLHAHRAQEARRHRRRLHVGGEPDAHEPARGPGRRRLLAPLFAREQGARVLEGLVDADAVQIDAEAASPLPLGGGQEVAPPQLGGIEAQSARREVEHALAQEGLHLPRAAVGDVGRLVGRHHRGREGEVLQAVRSREQGAHQVGVARGGVADLRVGAEVGDQVHAQCEEAPVGVEPDLHVGVRLPGVPRGEQVLSAGLGPRHRSGEEDRRSRECGVFARQAALLAERAAHERADHAHVVAVEAEGAGEQDAQLVG